jgi:hypothetical protein
MITRTSGCPVPWAFLTPLGEWLCGNTSI